LLGYIKQKGDYIMKLFDRFFRKELAECNLCDRKIYQGDYYGHEREASSLSITGYSNYYFCKTCIERHCTSSLLDKEKLGEKFIISRRNRERSRITIKQ
jgi:hypothetical protein